MAATAEAVRDLAAQLADAVRRLTDCEQAMTAVSSTIDSRIVEASRVIQED